MSKNIVVITGAGSGLGAALAKKYSSLGNHICLLVERDQSLRIRLKL